MNLDQAIASRTFRGMRGGNEFTISAYLGKPERASPPDSYYSCPYQITGPYQSIPLKEARGADALQALQLAMKMLEIDLVELREECDGNLWWELAPRMGLDLAWPLE